MRPAAPSPSSAANASSSVRSSPRNTAAAPGWLEPLAGRGRHLAQSVRAAALEPLPAVRPPQLGRRLDAEQPAQVGNRAAGDDHHARMAGGEDRLDALAHAVVRDGLVAL